MVRVVYISKDSTRASVLDDVCTLWGFDAVDKLGIGDDYREKTHPDEESFLVYVRRHIPFEYFDDPTNVFAVRGYEKGQRKIESIILFQDLAYGGLFLVRFKDREAFLATPPSPYFDPEVEARPFAEDGRPFIWKQKMSAWGELSRRQRELREREGKLEAKKVRVEQQKEFADGIVKEFYSAGHTAGFLDGLFKENPDLGNQAIRDALRRNEEKTERLAVDAMEAVGDAEEDVHELEVELEENKAELSRTRQKLDATTRRLVASDRQIKDLRSELAKCDELKDIYGIRDSLAMPLGRKRLNGGGLI